MSFAFIAPLALAALGLVAAPVIVHMLRRSKSHRLDFPSLRFLRETPSLVRRLTPPDRRWLLAARMAIICLIALAAARPVWTGQGQSSGSATVILIDASASMSRPEAREAAISAAREAIGRFSENDLISVAQFDRRVSWLARDVGREEAQAALAAYSPGLAAGLPANAVEQVGRSLADSPRATRRIVLVSDFQRSNEPWSEVQPGATYAIETISVENSYENAFVADAAVETGKDGDRLVVSVVRADSGGRSVGRAEAPLVDGAAADGLLVSRSEDSWTAKVSVPDGFDADDARVGVVEARGSVVVCDPGAGAPFLSAAARVNEGDARVSVVPRIDAAALLRASTVIVSSRALGAEGASSALEAWLRGGGSALVFTTSPGTPVAGAPVVGQVDDSPTTVSLAVAPESPAAIAMRATRLEVCAVEAAGDDAVIARDGAGRPVVVRRKLGSGTVTVAGFEPTPESGRLVYDGAFPDVVRVLVGVTEAATLEVGETLTGLPPDASVEIAGRRLTAQAGGTVQLDAPGVVRVTTPDGVRLLAVNVAASESEPGQLSAEEVAALSGSISPAGVSAAAALEASEQRWPLWRILLLLALAGSIAELAFAGRRRRTGGSRDADDVALRA